MRRKEIAQSNRERLFAQRKEKNTTEGAPEKGQLALRSLSTTGSQETVFTKPCNLKHISALTPQVIEAEKPTARLADDEKSQGTKLRPTESDSSHFIKAGLAAAAALSLFSITQEATSIAAATSPPTAAGEAIPGAGGASTLESINLPTNSDENPLLTRAPMGLTVAVAPIGKELRQQHGTHEGIVTKQEIFEKAQVQRSEETHTTAVSIVEDMLAKVIEETGKVALHRDGSNKVTLVACTKLYTGGAKSQIYNNDDPIRPSEVKHSQGMVKAVLQGPLPKDLRSANVAEFAKNVSVLEITTVRAGTWADTAPETKYIFNYGNTEMENEWYGYSVPPTRFWGLETYGGQEVGNTNSLRDQTQALLQRATILADDLINNAVRQ